MLSKTSLGSVASNCTLVICSGIPSHCLYLLQCCMHLPWMLWPSVGVVEATCHSTIFALWCWSGTPHYLLVPSELLCSCGPLESLCCPGRCQYLQPFSAGWVVVLCCVQLHCLPFYSNVPNSVLYESRKCRQSWCLQMLKYK